MSIEAVRDFVVKVTESAVLRDAWNAAGGPEGVAALAAENGYEFTAAELEKTLGARELDESELEQVTGGGTYSDPVARPCKWRHSEFDGKSTAEVSGWKTTVDNLAIGN